MEKIHSRISEVKTSFTWFDGLWEWNLWVGIFFVLLKKTRVGFGFRSKSNIRWETFDWTRWPRENEEKCLKCVCKYIYKHTTCMSTRTVPFTHLCVYIRIIYLFLGKAWIQYTLHIQNCVMTNNFLRFHYTLNTTHKHTQTHLIRWSVF